MSKEITLYNGDGIIAILHCDSYDVKVYDDKMLVNLYKIENDDDYEISYNIYLGNIWCTRYVVVEG